MKKIDTHIFSGMQQDSSISKQAAEFLRDALNIRITAREDRTSFSITNERGPSEISLVFERFVDNAWEHQEDVEKLLGRYLGHCILNNYLVVFTYINENISAIYRVDLIPIQGNNTYRATELYRGNLNFHPDYPIEATSYYENNNVQKVYWTDNRNPPRVINIAPARDFYNIAKKADFSFTPELALEEEVTVTKLYSGGFFASGVIQYAITYYNKNAQETNIAVVTPLYYISPSDRGGTPEETCSNSFIIKITNPDINFEYLRIYSIQRTSLNATPICKRIQDIELDNASSVQYTDTGTSGDVIDPTELLYKGGEAILAETLCQKDNTLFFGNITIGRPAIEGNIKNLIDELFTASPETTKNHLVQYMRRCNSNIVATGDFAYANTLIENCAGFKAREYYRFGLQFQYKTGAWSEPIWVGDFQLNGTPSTRVFDGVPINFKYGITIADLDQEYQDKRGLNLIQSLISLGYKKVRPLIAEPSWKDRTILFQGVYNPTVYRLTSRYNNVVPLLPGMEGYDGTKPEIEPSYVADDLGPLYAQASWIFRPSMPKDKLSGDKKLEDGGGIITGGNGVGIIESLIEHPSIGKQLAGLQPYMYSTEIGGQLVENINITVVDGDPPVIKPYRANKFVVETYYENNKPSVATINSPDIYWDTDIQNFNFGENIKLTYAGFAHCRADYGDIDITTSSGTIGAEGAGFVHSPIKTKGYGALISQLCYQDSIVDDSENGDKFGLHRGEPGFQYPVLWTVYMWHRNGSLNNDVNRSGRTAMLNTKKISNYRIATTTWLGNPEKNKIINDVQIFNSDTLSYIKVDGKSYMGNIDTLITTNLTPYFFSGDPTDPNFWKEQKITKSTAETYLTLSDDSKGVGIKWVEENDEWKWDEWDKLSEIADFVPGLGSSREGIRMKYKSTPHAVISGEFISVPYSEGAQSTESLEDEGGNLPIVEIGIAYNQDTLYGGQSEEALKENKWIPAGKAVPLKIDESDPDNPVADVKIIWEYGDTFFNRWDCLKTYAFTPQDQNQVIDILSFPVESRVNLDGRYDRNRGMASNLNASPTNYNLMNMVYSQLDNFFSYRIMDSDYYKLNTFGNQVAWSLEKQSGAETDTWTNITLSSTYDVDGSKGQIRALKTWKDTIYCFQDTGICQIIFNPRVQIPTSDNIPIEIGNSRKVEGIRYVSDNLGCTNKSAITSSSSGIYFTDSISKDLYIISTEGLVGLSNKLNFGTWFNNVPQGKWTPNNYSSKLFYDNVEQDVYITTSDECLCFSEKLGQFVSFLSYENSLAMINTESTLFNLRSNTNESENYVSIWKMFAGDYNIFFNEYKSFSISFISNAEVAVSKIFTNIEARADFYDNLEDEEGEPFIHSDNPINNRKINPKKFFNKLRVKTEYQDTGEVELNWKNFLTYHSYEDFISQNTAKKNRIWRVTIPRDKDHKLDRIRNTWAEVSMTYDNEDNAYMELHDLSVQYHTNK